MKQRNLITIVLGILLLIIALCLTISFSKKPADKINQNSQFSADQNNSEEEYRRSDRTNAANKVDRTEIVIAQFFSKKDEARFLTEEPAADIDRYYHEKGLTNIYSVMRSALRGNENAIAEIFTTYQAEPEGYSFLIETLIKNLGDKYFYQQISKQPSKIQYQILGQIWQSAFRSPLKVNKEEIIEGTVNDGYYPQCGNLFLQLHEQELKSDYRKKQKTKRR